MPFNTFTVASAVTPSVIETYFSHFLHRAPLKQKPTAHISYHEGLALIRNFLEYASKHTVEDLQAFTQQWVPAPAWIRVQNVEVPQQFLERAAESLVSQLGEQGLRDVGGKTWWRWRGPAISPMKAEWIEMKKDYNERRSGQKPYDKVILYVHGGAYYFGSVDEHRYQMQRHARKLKARVLAPRYRLAPQYPFPCGLQDCLATYLFLLEQLPPNQILLAGDSAGGGMVLGMLVTMRDQGIPLPAGSILLSPWSDLTHSFPSVAGKGEGDYIPSDGLSLYKPSLSWPPAPAQAGNGNKTTTEAEVEPKTRKRTRSIKSSRSMRKESVKNLLEAGGIADGTRGQASTNGEHVDAGKASIGANGLATSTGENTAIPTTATDNATPRPGFGSNLSVELDGKTVEILDQIQLYTTNQALCNPLVSPVLQPSLGGLPPMLIQVGSAELLCDEQIYLAHKAANPKAYPPSDSILDRYDPERKVLDRYGPTDVQLQVWEDLCHVPHTLSFTRPAKYMYRGVAQFGFWALARAQRQDLSSRPDGEDNVSIISSGDDEAKDDPNASRSNLQTPEKQKANGYPLASDPANDSSAVGSLPASAKLAEKAMTVGKAGDPLPEFHNNMIRQRVSRHGAISTLEPESEIRALQLKNTEIGILKPVPVRKYLNAKKVLDGKFAKEMRKVEKLRTKDIAKGYEVFAGERPPPTALAARRRKGMDDNKKKIGKSWGLAMWSGWGSKHDENTIEREEEAQKDKERATPISAGIARTSTRASTSPPNSNDASEPRKSRRSSMLGGGLSVGKDRDRPRTSNSRSPWRKEGDLRPQTSREHLTSASQSNLITNTPPNTTSSNNRPMSMAAPPTMSAAQPDSKKVEGTDGTFLAPNSSRPHNGTVAYPFKLRNAVWNPSTATLDSQAPDGTFAAAAVTGSTEHPTSISKSDRSTPLNATPRSEKARSFIDGGITGAPAPVRNAEADTSAHLTAQEEQTQPSESRPLPARLDSLPSNDKKLDDKAGPPRRAQTVEDEGSAQAAAEGGSVVSVPRRPSGDETEPPFASDVGKNVDAPNRAQTFGDEASAQAAADGGSVVTVPRRTSEIRPDSARTGSDKRVSANDSATQSPPVSRGSKEPATSSKRSSASPALVSEQPQQHAQATSPPVSPVSPASPVQTASPRAMNRVSAIMTGSPSSTQSQKSRAPAEAVDKPQPALPWARPLTAESDDIPPTPPPKDDVSMSTAQAVRLSRANVAAQSPAVLAERKRSAASPSGSSFDMLQHQQQQQQQEAPQSPLQQKERYSPIPAPTSRFSTILPNAPDFSGNGMGQMGESKHEARRPQLESFVTASEGLGLGGGEKG